MIVKWGNSNAIRLPKSITDVLGLRENDPVEIKVEGNAIIIRKPFPSSLHELFDDYVGDCKSSEWDTAEPVGREICE